MFVELHAEQVWPCPGPSRSAKRSSASREGRETRHSARKASFVPRRVIGLVIGARHPRPPRSARSLGTWHQARRPTLALRKAMKISGLAAEVRQHRGHVPVGARGWYVKSPSSGSRRPAVQAVVRSSQDSERLGCVVHLSLSWHHPACRRDQKMSAVRPASRVVARSPEGHFFKEQGEDKGGDPERCRHQEPS